jgi:hypothetical protein
MVQQTFWSMVCGKLASSARLSRMAIAQIIPTMADHKMKTVTMEAVNCRTALARGG